MDYNSEENEGRTNREQSETLAEFRGSFESQPDRHTDGRLMYYENQAQKWPDYSGPLDTMTIEEVRFLFGEVLRYFEACSWEDFPLPPAGLPGCMNKKFDRDGNEAELISIGLGYLEAIANNERRTMHHRWQEARDFIREQWREGRDFCYDKMHEERDQLALAKDARRTSATQFVYFIGAASGPIKIGMALRPKQRMADLQTSHHEKLELLATCGGGPQQERAYHQQFQSSRLHGEWFERTSELLAEIDRLNELAKAA